MVIYSNVDLETYVKIRVEELGPEGGSHFVHIGTCLISLQGLGYPQSMSVGLRAVGLM